MLQVETTPSSLCMTEVKSGGGHKENNFASFKLNGQLINPPTGRGFNILVVSEDWKEQEDFKVFDTWKSKKNSKHMFDFLHNLQEGACILVAVKDEASYKITAKAKLALENYGATQAFDIGFRAAYALIGCKGLPKVKEQLVAPSSKKGTDAVTPWICPERCEWGEWAEWEDCSEACGGGEERRTREKAQEGEPGGWLCEGEAEETRPCNEQDCTTTTNVTTTMFSPILKAGATRFGLCSAVALAMAACATVTPLQP